MENILLECRNVCKSFEKDRAKYSVLHGVNLKIERGGFVCIYGQSGAGKSVLLSLVGCIDRPTSGKILLAETELTSLSPAKLARIRRSEIGMIFQNFNLISYWTALENVEAALMNGNAREDIKSAGYLLDQLGLSHRKNNYPSELSIGEQQRVAVARTLSRNPKLIVADEPTGEVDEATSRKIIDLLMNCNREKGIALLIATHGHFPMEKANRVYELKEGELEDRNEEIKRSSGIES
jgi:putative ABC transport system ATP-binding protein